MELLGAHFIATDDQHRVVKADKVAEEVVALLVLVPVFVIAIIVVVGWDPGLVPGAFLFGQQVGLLDEEEPHAGHQVQVNDEKGVVVEHLEQTFAALLHVGLRDQG